MKCERTPSGIAIWLSQKDTCRWNVDTSAAGARWRSRIKRSLRRMLAARGGLRARVHTSRGAIVFESVPGEGDRINKIPTRGRRDVLVDNLGSIVVFTPETPAGREWCEKHLGPDTIRMGASIACEPRFALDVVEGMQLDGVQVYV